MFIDWYTFYLIFFKNHFVNNGKIDNSTINNKCKNCGWRVLYGMHSYYRTIEVILGDWHDTGRRACWAEWKTGKVAVDLYMDMGIWIGYILVAHSSIKRFWWRYERNIQQRKKQHPEVQPAQLNEHIACPTPHKHHNCHNYPTHEIISGEFAFSERSYFLFHFLFC